MKVAVFDVAAEMGGAMTVLHAFHAVAAKLSDIEWVYCLSGPHLEEGGTTRVVVTSWIKRSWIHRLFFDLVVARRVIRDERVDVVISLQNLAIPGCEVPQLLYVHQALPFAKLRFKLTRHPLLWAYQNLIGAMILNGARRAAVTVVQTHTMKEQLLSRVPTLEASRVRVISPEVPQAPSKRVDHARPNSGTIFLYPAGPAPYKNHALLLEAWQRALRSGCEGELVLTITQPQLSRLSSTASELGRVRAVGYLPHGQVLSLYQESVLVFPSLIESFPLPLIEARGAGALILCADTAFGREILGDYPNAFFFDGADEADFAQLLVRASTGELKTVDPTQGWVPTGLGWNEVISCARGMV